LIEFIQRCRKARKRTKTIAAIAVVTAN